MVRLIDAFSADDNLSPLAIRVVYLELAGQALVPGAHYVANRGFKVANMLLIVDVYIIDVKP